MIYDISERSRPVVISRVDAFSEPIVDVALHDGHAYLATMRESFVVDVQDIQHPRLVPGDFLYSADRLRIHDGLLLAGGWEGLFVYELSDPSWPTLVGELRGPDIRDLIAIDELIYTVTNDGLEVVDIQHPESPDLVALIRGEHYSLHHEGEYLYLLGFLDHLQVLDLQDPLAPQLIREVDCNVEAAPHPYHGRLVVHGSRAFIAGWDRFTQCSMADKAPLSADMRYGDHYYAVDPGLQVRDGHAFVAGTDGLQIFAIDGARRPQRIGLAASLGPMDVVTVGEGSLYATGGRRLTVFERHDSTVPELLGQVDLEVRGHDLHVADSRAYIVGEGGMEVVGLDSPDEPAVLGRFDTFSIDSVRVAGSTAYLASESSGLHVVDVSDATDPHQIGHAPELRSRQIELRAGHAYLASEDGLRIVDITDPRRPKLVDSYLEGREITGLALEDDRLYAATVGPARLYTLDVSVPSALATRLEWPGAGPLRSISVDAGLVWFDDFSGLHVLDARMPDRICRLAEHETGTVKRIAAMGSQAFVAQGSGGLGWLELPELAAPGCPAPSWLYLPALEH